jgi:hypothetical protein
LGFLQGVPFSVVPLTRPKARAAATSMGKVAPKISLSVPRDQCLKLETQSQGIQDLLHWFLL